MLKLKHALTAAATTAAILFLLSPYANAASKGDDYQPPKTFQSACERQLSPGTVEVDFYAGPTRYDRSRSVAELTAMPAHGKIPGAVTLGLTESKVHLSLGWKGEMLVDAMTQLNCVRPRISVSLQLPRQTVYLASGLQENTCGYREVLAHEERHVAVNLAHARLVAQRLEEELKKAFGSRVFYAPQSELHRAINNSLERDWTIWAQDLLDEAGVHHRQIDTEEELQRMSAVCEGELQPLLRSVRQQ